MGIWQGGLYGSEGTDNFSYNEIHELITIPVYQQMIVVEEIVIETIGLNVDGQLILEV